VKNDNSPFRRKLSIRVAAVLVAFVIAGAMFALAFGNAILNGYGKDKVERAFSQAHPGYALRIGKLDYKVGANRLIAQSVSLIATNATLKVGRVMLTGVCWARLFWGIGAPADVLASARLDATNFDLEFPQAHYGVRCGRLRASVRDSEFIAEKAELRPLGGDEVFFAAHTFRTPRFFVVVPELKVLGLAYAELFDGRGYRARSVQIVRPLFDALVNRDKSSEPFVKSPLMLHEALAAIRLPLQVENLSLTNGAFRYCERLAVGADLAVLTFDNVSLAVDGLANRGDATATIQLRGQGDLMNAGTMKMLMTIPVNSLDLSLRYSGSISAIDLTRLDGFLDIAEHTRIKSGSARAAVFEIQVIGGHASGYVRAAYRDLEIAVLDKQTGSETAVVDRIASFFANTLKIRNVNTMDGSGPRKDGEVKYTRRPQDEFQQFVWFALRTGVMDVISL
jgi:hypothetical protein